MTSLDELPQLINALRGDMSLVGPRPERPEYVARFARDISRYEDRHRVKSGITGWAQVNGLRGQTSIADRVEWDNFYIQNWSVRFDLRILMLTLLEVLKARQNA
jgi:lipopolysaccharide/colanic/teichoic acid biosynthesis glycosyltransferase